MKKALIVLAIGILVLLAALGSVVYDKFRAFEEIKNRIQKMEDSTKNHVDADSVRKMTDKLLMFIDSTKKNLTHDSLKEVKDR